MTKQTPSQNRYKVPHKLFPNSDPCHFYSSPILPEDYSPGKEFEGWRETSANEVNPMFRARFITVGDFKTLRESLALGIAKFEDVYLPQTPMEEARDKGILLVYDGQKIKPILIEKVEPPFEQGGLESKANTSATIPVEGATPQPRTYPHQTQPSGARRVVSYSQPPSKDKK